jgi:phenylacetate-CoA ligase
MDELTVLVEGQEGLGSDEREGLARQISGMIKHRIGITARVQVVEPGGVERSIGKARRIVDNRPHD